MHRACVGPGDSCDMLGPVGKKYSNYQLRSLYNTPYDCTSCTMMDASACGMHMQ